ncbi:septal ring lytic transglycosylase RlpA family protein [Nitrosomonas halophila]|uniref:Endolytic peptidoglycan transglycosylase RlpA n=1 Tax=Nitrosomonas halophila TaxID=44576 RepID=A0A1H3E622_9PROT|nr:septal ring lytic transglycosylase RlpA family protein [Nitrosomonas halophila]SDX73384.1 rare lipoprotein A [Nitrosomonas halophila]
MTNQPDLSRRNMMPLIPFLVIATLYLTSCNSLSPSKQSANRIDKQYSSHAIKGGGYYLDDGPGHNPPANLDAISDAVPRKEALRTANMRPYVALGKTYTPMTRLEPYKERGHASWYGRRYHGKKTASGEIYDMYAMTAAHPTLPIPSYARVTHLQNGKSVIVRINDRGPFLSNRLIDLSYVAAYKLNILANGSAWVEVESIVPGQASAHLDQNQTPSAMALKSSSQASELYYLQLAAFGSARSAHNYLAQLRSDLPAMSQQARIDETSGLYKILVGPFENRHSAGQAADIITESISIKPMLVQHTAVD